MNAQLTIEQADISIRITQPFSRRWDCFAPWLDLWVTLKSCPQPPVGGVLGSTLPLCTYRGATAAAALGFKPFSATVLSAGTVA